MNSDLGRPVRSDDLHRALLGKPRGRTATPQAHRGGRGADETSAAAIPQAHRGGRGTDETSAGDVTSLDR